MKVLDLGHIETAPKFIRKQLTIERNVLRRFGFSDHELRIVECDRYKWQIVPAKRFSQLKNIKCIAFDCFGTLFDMSQVSRDEIKAYVEHVRKEDFTEYSFPKSWMDIPAFRDVAWGIRDLRRAGYKCWALSNGSVRLLSHVAIRNFVELNGIVDLAKHRVYKPHVDAYRTIEKETGFKPEETLMVTANPTFGDIEGAAAIGMPSQVVRHGYPNTIIELADMLRKTKEE